MAVLVTLTGKFVNPDEAPALVGKNITFQLVPADIPDKALNETVVPGPVTVPITAGGVFTVTLRATDDPDLLANVSGPLVYKVTRQGITGNYLIALPAPGPHDWSDIVPEPNSTTVVVAGPAGAAGPPGPPGPETTVNVFTYTDETDLRPSSDVVFWIPDPYTLDDPFGALPGDLVLRSTPDVVQGLNGITGLWKGTPLEWEALPTHDDSTVYFVISP
jgi:hypothetical protein